MCKEIITSKEYTNLENGILENNTLLKRAIEIINGKLRKNLEYKNKKSKIKGIYLISENPLIVKLTQKKFGRNSERIISKESFFSNYYLNNKIFEELGKNRKNPEKFGVKNPKLLKILKIFDTGKWEKVYILSCDKKKEVHFFQSENGLVYDFKTIKYD